MSSRAFHTSRTTASARRSFIRCIPEVRRHGSARGGGGGVCTIAANSCSAHVHLPCRPAAAPSAVAQLDEHLDVQCGVDQPVVRQRTGGPVGGAVPLAQVQPEHLLHERPEADPGQAGQPARQLGVEQPTGPDADLGQAGQILVRRVQHPLRVRQRLVEHAEIPAQRDRDRAARCRGRRGAAAPGTPASRSGSRTRARRPARSAAGRRRRSGAPSPATRCARRSARRPARRTRAGGSVPAARRPPAADPRERHRPRRRPRRRRCRMSRAPAEPTWPTAER